MVGASWKTQGSPGFGQLCGQDTRQSAGSWLAQGYISCLWAHTIRQGASKMAPAISPSSSPHFQKSLVLPEDSMVLSFSYWPLVTPPLRSAVSPSSWVYTLSLKSLCCRLSRVSLGKRCMHLIHHLHQEPFLFVLLFYRAVFGFLYSLTHQTFPDLPKSARWSC